MTVHEPAVGATVEWYTPKSLFDSLGVTFDLDPAGTYSRYASVPAPYVYTRDHDGLERRWWGHVWLNPPYGRQAVPFVDRMITHGDGLLLLPSRTETAVYQRALRQASTTCFLRDRLWFVREDGHTGRWSFGSTLFAFGPWADKALRRADLGYTR